MKKTLLIAVLSGAVVSAYAWPDYEPFNYTPGVSLIGQVNPNGLKWEAVGVPEVPIRVQAGNLTVPALALPAGNMILLRSFIGPSGRLPIGPTISNGTQFRVQSSLCLPLSAGGEPPVGALALSTVRTQRDWPDALVQRLTLVGQVFTHALARKRADDALRESEERSRATFEQAAVGIAHVGTDGRWLRVNDRLCAIVGYPREGFAAVDLPGHHVPR